MKRMRLVSVPQAPLGLPTRKRPFVLPPRRTNMTLAVACTPPASVADRVIVCRLPLGSGGVNGEPPVEKAPPPSAVPEPTLRPFMAKVRDAPGAQPDEVTPS